MRMGLSVPKQFLSICGEPIIIKSIRAFAESGLVDKIIVAVSLDFEEYTKKLIKEFLPEVSVSVVIGGKNRNETLFNVLKKIAAASMNDDDIILTHDAVRPFISSRIIKDNIEAAKKYGACDTVVPAVDTVVHSSDGKTIDRVPDRSELFNGQTPQSFNAKLLFDIYCSMSDSELEQYTDACGVLLSRGKTVALVNGDRNNFKITYPEDIKRAEISAENT